MVPYKCRPVQPLTTFATIPHSFTHPAAFSFWPTTTSLFLQLRHLRVYCHSRRPPWVKARSDSFLVSSMCDAGPKIQNIALLACGRTPMKARTTLLYNESRVALRGSQCWSNHTQQNNLESTCPHTFSIVDSFARYQALLLKICWGYGGVTSRDWYFLLLIIIAHITPFVIHTVPLVECKQGVKKWNGRKRFVRRSS